jgi:hypothetical protein
MAYNFVGASAQRVFAENIASFQPPFTISAIINPVTQNVNRAIVSFDSPAGITAGRQTMFAGSTNLLQIQSLTNGSNFASGFTDNTVVINVFNHCTGRWAATNSRQPILENVVGTENTSNFFVTFNRLQIGVRQGNSLENYMNGRIAEVAIWNVSLTNDEATSLYRGFKPSRVRPQSLVYYVPLLRNRVEVRTGLELSVSTSAPQPADHPRVY